MPDVRMRIDRAASRWCSNDFKLVSEFWGTLGNDENGNLSMRATHSSYFPYYYLKHHRDRVVEYAIVRDLDKDPYYVPGERGLSGWTGFQAG